MKIKLIIPLLCLISIVVFAQNRDDKKYIIEQTNIEKLNEIYLEFLEIEDRYKDKPHVNQYVDENGDVMFFSHFDIDGTPLYYSLENDSSAISSKIDRIRSGGSTGLNLDGTNIEFGVWDSGPPRVTHQEFDNNITIVDQTQVSHHATHVTGILIAKGMLSQAKGMAPKATVRSYTSSGSFQEVPLWASTGGMISNHSYILANPGTNYQLYGIYNTYSRIWDEISYNAPYLIMCTGASNNGSKNYNPDNSRYDLLASNKLGKNAIVVGACSDVLNYTGPSSVNQAPFTSWGPTDDWRIKPDITAVGTNSYSTREANDSHYAYGQGCSYAAPIVSGGLGLLQQHYHNFNSVYMKATTAKALILSTTDEAGLHDGPDFSNGWGLFNAEKAASVITNEGISSSISELSLNQGENYTYQIQVDGTEPLTVALCWNDPAASPLFLPEHNDPTPMLINDLDVRVVSGNQLYYPWMMQPNATFDNYTTAATKGDNFRDNIEIINVEDIDAGTYMINVTHKGTLMTGKQDFSLIVNGLKSNTLSNLKLETDQEGFVVFSDPLRQILNIEFNVKDYTELKVDIYNMHGESQLDSKLINADNNSIEVNQLSKGVYVLRIKDVNSNRVVSTQKVLIY